MSAYATQHEVQVIVDKAVTELSDIISTFAQQIDGRFSKLEVELSELRESHQRLLNTIDSFIGRIDRYETEQPARDNQFKRLLEWAHKASEKTGIPLENL